MDMLSYFKGKTIAICGFDDQGLQHAKILREHDISVLIVLREGTSQEKWEEEGFNIVSLWTAMDKADIVQVW